MAPSRASSADSGRPLRESIHLEGQGLSLAEMRLPTDEEDGYYQTFTRPSRWSQLLENLRLMSIRRRSNHSYQPATTSNHSPNGKNEYHFDSSRLMRPSTVWSTIKQACLVIPALILMIFGLLHFMQVLIGRASILWDIDHDNFLPNWGKPGHFGEGLASYPTDATRGVIPVPVHSHNDYWRRIPLFEALHYGCIGVEADVWLFDDDLFVGHNTAALSRNRTFRSLYIDPLVSLLDKMNPQTEFANTSRHGVWDTDHEQTLVLLVDLKTDGELTLPVVEKQLAPLREKGYLTYFDGEKTIPGAITVVGTGNTPFDLLMANTTYRDIFFDAPLERLWETPKSYMEPESPESIEDAEAELDPTQPRSFEEAGNVEVSDIDRRGQGSSGIGPEITASAFDRDNSYYASIDFQKAVGIVWRGHLTPRQIHIIRGQIHGAKKRGLKARYWNTPIWPISVRNHVWHILVREGADMLNADDVKAAATQDWRRWRHEWW